MSYFALIHPTSTPLGHIGLQCGKRGPSLVFLKGREGGSQTSWHQRDTALFIQGVTALDILVLIHPKTEGKKIDWPHTNKKSLF